MNLLRELIWTVATGSSYEILDLKKVLSSGDGEELRVFFEDLDEDTSCAFWSGLVPYVIQEWARIFPGIPVALEDAKGFSSERAPELELDSLSVTPELMPGLVELGQPLRDYQVSVIRKALYAGRGIAALATGSGKTRIGAGFLYYLREVAGLTNQCLFLVDGLHLLDQAYDDLKECGIEGVGRIGGGRFQPGKAYVVATVDSLWDGISRNDPSIYKLMDNAGAVVFDEVAHLRARTWVAVGQRLKAKYRLGLDAAPYDPTGKDEAISPDFFPLVGLTGPILAKIPAAYLWRRGYLAEPFVTMLKVGGGEGLSPQVKNWNAVYERGILENLALNEQLVQLARWLYSKSLHVMMLTQRREHSLRLCKMLADCEVPAVNMVGGKQCRFYDSRGQMQQETWDIKQYSKWVKGQDASVTVATQVFDQGVDIPGMNALIPCGGIKKYRPIIQRMGRVMRPKPGTKYCFVFDVWHTNHFFLTAQSKKRVAVYESEQIKVHWDLQDVVKEIERMGV